MKVFTPQYFFAYSTCPNWIWHDFHSDPKDKGELSELTLKLFEYGVLHEEECIKDLQYESVTVVDPEQAFDQTLKLMVSGAELIYQGEIQYEKEGIMYRGRPDLLKKVEGKSKLGDYYYTPIDIKSSKEIAPEQKFQLVMYATILEGVQGFFPPSVAIINGEKNTIELDVSIEVREEMQKRINEILSIINGKKPPMKLISSCKSSPWYAKCLVEAEAVEDIALIYKLDARSFPVLRENNINTIHDAAKMIIADLPKVPHATIETLERAKLQAQSLVDKEVKWVSDPVVPDASLKLYFDIEGDPLLKVEYLFGFWVVGDAEEKYAKIGKVRSYQGEGKYFLYFIAEQPEDEAKLWGDFLSWVSLLPKDYCVYHYANYERTRTSKLSLKYGTSEHFKNFLTKLVDLEKIRKECVVFPLYFYSIKDIAKSKFLNFKWRHEKAGGAQSIFWYEKWIETHDKSVLDDIVDYNEDDVRATEFLHMWFLEEYKKSQKT